MWLVLVFPNFVRQAVSQHVGDEQQADARKHKQGANAEVIARLRYFSELNGVRTVFRVVYASCMFSLAIDGFTPAQYLNNSQWVQIRLGGTR
jgi:predicted DNA-binding protein (MmcQ/YjbR family)